MQAKSPKTFIEELPNLELQSVFSQSEDVYLSSSPMVSIAISTDLPPNKKEDLLKIIQKRKKGIVWDIVNFCDIIYSLGMQIWLEDSGIGLFHWRKRINLVMKDKVPSKIVKWTLEDVWWNFALRCEIVKKKIVSGLAKYVKQRRFLGGNSRLL